MTPLHFATLTVLVSAALTYDDPLDYMYLAKNWAMNNITCAGEPGSNVSSGCAYCSPFAHLCDTKTSCCVGLSCIKGRCLQTECGGPNENCGLYSDCCWHMGLKCSTDWRGQCRPYRIIYGFD